jgi:hypothetical protein
MLQRWNQNTHFYTASTQFYAFVSILLGCNDFDFFEKMDVKWDFKTHLLKYV